MNAVQDMQAVLPGSHRAHLKALTGLRTFAALHVLGRHFALPLITRDVDSLHARVDPSFAHRLATVAVDAVMAFLQCGAASVSLFFVLSGFILAYNYLDPSAVRQTSRRDFWIARLARVYPAYFLAWIIATPSAINQLHHGDVRASAVKTILLPPASLIAVHAWVPSWALGWNAPSWSLCTEAFFYLLFPLLFVINRPQASEHAPGARHRQRWIFLSWIAIAVLIPTMYVVLDPDRLGFQGMCSAKSLDLSTLHWLPALTYFPLLRQPELLAGVALGHLFLLDVRENHRLSNWVAPLAAILVVTIFLMRRVIPFAFYSCGALAPIFAFLIYALAHGGWIARLLSSKILVLFGEASYALYILHVPLAGWFRVVAKKIAPAQFAGLDGELARTPNWTYFWIYTLGMLLISVLVFLIVETPGRYWIRKRLSPATTA